MRPTPKHKLNPTKSSSKPKELPQSQENLNVNGSKHDKHTNFDYTRKEMQMEPHSQQRGLLVLLSPHPDIGCD